MTGLFIEISVIPRGGHRVLTQLEHFLNRSIAVRGAFDRDAPWLTGRFAPRGAKFPADLDQVVAVPEGLQGFGHSIHPISLGDG